MKKKTTVELERDRLIKIQRTLIRLKYSLKADEEINDTIPASLDAFDTAVQNGELLALQPHVKDILEEV